ncbi:hypothetical protein [Microseira wollei]|uniref:Uncharacterized protein n=1 Tax=Microseira wollei NIES-4236 TaxID=2530354 RepID=A0AAV3XB96_9CYAN|nr:hypothetical protein [Microseira wollei]GET39453.1 hypothetical protein MiSe_42220 [Microseira wollei NIES-4236]
MIITPKSVPELLRESIPDVPPGKYPIRLLACGVPKGVESVVRQLYVVRFAEVEEWSPPLPSPVRGEVIRILTRYWVE